MASIIEGIAKDLKNIPKTIKSKTNMAIITYKIVDNMPVKSAQIKFI